MLCVYLPEDDLVASVSTPRFPILPTKFSKWLLSHQLFNLCDKVVPFLPKKQLGQHFLKDATIAQRIVEALEGKKTSAIVEIGPGQGALTKWLTTKFTQPLYLIEKDDRLVHMLKQQYTEPSIEVIHEDFLTWSPPTNLVGQISLVGNLPYNISSQIFFAVLAQRHRFEEVVCMVQEEVAQRIASVPGNKTYGVLSVLLQAFYDVSYLFGVPPPAFDPPPKVFSGVLRLRALHRQLACDEKAFFRVVKAGFQQRRKMLRNALSTLNKPMAHIPDTLLTKRAEALGVQDFVLLTQMLYPHE